MNKEFLGYSTDFKIRHSATSGGIGSSCLKYLFETNRISSALTFFFDESDLMYKPRIIYSFDDYQISGSIYHEIEIIKFIRENVNSIKGSFACFALPCQVKAIRNILSKNGIESYIFELYCSSQQEFSATEYLLERERIKKESVKHIKYRGDGWPSGISIMLKDGEEIKIPNNNSVWTKIFHSKLFIMNRCFSCNPATKSFADITLADPWRIENPEVEKVGKTLCCIRTERMDKVINEMLSNKLIDVAYLSDEKLNYSQEFTIKRKNNYRKNKKVNNLLRKFMKNKFLISFLLKNPLSFNLYIRIKNKLESILHKI